MAVILLIQVIENIIEILRFTHLYFPKSIGQLLHDDLPSLDELAKFLLLLKEKSTLGKPAAFVGGIPTEIIEIFCCRLFHLQNSEQNEIEGADYLIFFNFFDRNFVRIKDCNGVLEDFQKNSKKNWVPRLEFFDNCDKNYIFQPSPLQPSLDDLAKFFILLFM